MRSGGFIILFFVAWIVAALWKFARAKETSTDAKQTAAYIVCYPIVAVLALEERPLPMVAATILVMAGLPWLLAGIHLGKALNAPSASKPREFIGLPAKLWLLGIGLSVAIPLVFGGAR